MWVWSNHRLENLWKIGTGRKCWIKNAPHQPPRRLSSYSSPFQQTYLSSFQNYLFLPKIQLLPADSVFSSQSRYISDSSCSPGDVYEGPAVWRLFRLCPDCSIYIQSLLITSGLKRIHLLKVLKDSNQQTVTKDYTTKSQGRSGAGVIKSGHRKSKL